MSGPRPAHAAAAVPLAVLLLVVVPLLLGYLLALRRAGARGRWPVRRTVAWCAGLVAVGAAVSLPGHGDFVSHTAGHVLLGMLAPLLLVLAAPVTVALRALPAGRARLVTAVLRCRPVRLLTAPVPAALVTVGAMWVLYRTDLYLWSTQQPVIGLLVHAHLLLAGCLFAAAMVGPDPAPHRARLGTRAAVLVVAGAAHNVLAKSLYGRPPTGVTAAEAMAGAQVMYYGGAVVEIALLVMLGRLWRERERRTRRRSAGRLPPTPVAGLSATRWPW